MTAESRYKLLFKGDDGTSIFQEGRIPDRDDPASIGTSKNRTGGALINVEENVIKPILQSGQEICIRLRS